MELAYILPLEGRFWEFESPRGHQVRNIKMNKKTLNEHKAELIAKKSFNEHRAELIANALSTSQSRKVLCATMWFPMEGPDIGETMEQWAERKIEQLQYECLKLEENN